MIQPLNVYNQYFFALDSTFLEAKLTTPRSGRGQMLEAETKVEVNLSRPRPRPKVWPRGLNITGKIPPFLVNVQSTYVNCSLPRYIVMPKFDCSQSNAVSKNCSSGTVPFSEICSKTVGFELGTKSIYPKNLSQSDHNFYGVIRRNINIKLTKQ